MKLIMDPQPKWNSVTYEKETKTYKAQTLVREEPPGFFVEDAMPPTYMPKAHLYKDINDGWIWEDDQTSWQIMIEREMAVYGEKWGDRIACTLSDSELNFIMASYIEIGDLGARTAMTLWTQNRVYFACSYDGSYDCKSVPRHPCDEASLI